MVGSDVVGEFVVGPEVVGDEVVGETVVGKAVVGSAVVGSLLGDLVGRCELLQTNSQPITPVISKVLAS